MITDRITADEERLLLFYREFLSQNEQDELLYNIARIQFASHLDIQDFDVQRMIIDPDYLKEEIEEELKVVGSPMEVRGLMGIFFCDEPYYSILYSTAWNNIARVILGTSENDGSRADELYNTALKLFDYHRPMDFSRKQALELIETWREYAFSCLNSWNSR